MSRPKGMVYLVGAGPGDPGLLTLRGAELLARADVVIYDYLASPKLLAMARPEAEKIYVGKRSGEHTLSQGQINQLVVEKAQAGKEVVRLKGGDPFTFGRGGEEAEELALAGLSFEVVPGVTSAVSAPAYAGIPVTHRSFASCVTFATGHEDPTKETSSLNWPALAATGGTLVFLMGVKKLAQNAQALIEGGLEPSTPAALIQWGTLPRQRCLVSTLAEIAARAEEAGFTAPAVFVVGKVVGLRESLAWVEKRPLWGLKALVTRTLQGASRLAGMLEELGAEAIVFPTVELVPPEDKGSLQAAVELLAEFDWIIFTSANGVAYFFEELENSGRDSRALGGLKICAIGPGTAQALMDKGLKTDLVPKEFRGEAVAEALAGEAAQGKRFLIPRAQEAREILPERLRSLGGRVKVVAAYQSVLPRNEQAAEVEQMLLDGQIDVALFTASSTLKNLARLYPERSLKELLGRTSVAAIGPITAETARSMGLEVDVEAEEYTIGGLVKAVIAWRRGEGT